MEISSSDCGTRQFSTDELPERERLPRWREEFGRTLVRVEIEPLSFDTPFRATATLRRLPGVGVAFCSGSAARFNRTRAHASDSDGSIGFIVNLGPMAAVSHRNNELSLGCGAGVPVLTEETGVLDGTRHLGIVLPRAPLVSRIDRLDRVLMQPIPHDNRAWQLLLSYLSSLKDEPQLDGPTMQAAANYVLDLAALVLGANRDTREEGKSAIAAARLAAAIRYIGAHFSDPALSLAAVAQRQRISPRYLQELLGLSGVSFVARVNELRLKQALALLIKFPTRAVADIAAEVGFSNVAHFNRLFRSRFGDTPSELRRSVARD